jgi:hypothetical protein
LYIQPDAATKTEESIFDKEGKTRINGINGIDGIVG